MAGAGVPTINLKKAVANRVHSPQVDGSPMYVRVDGSADVGIGGHTTKSERWEQAAQKIRTSPNNVRRIYISKWAVMVDLFKPMTGRKGIHELFPLKSDDTENLETLIQAIQTGGQQNVIVNGTGLSCISTPWVCSNLEEIYFDGSVLVSQEAMNMGIGNLLNGLTQNVGYGHGEIIKELFIRLALPGGNESALKNYPRLRFVGYIDQLRRVHTAWAKAEKAQAEAGKIPLDKKLAGTFCGSQVVQSAIRDGNIATHIWDLQKPDLNVDYTVRSGIYVYDQDVLEPYFRGLTASLATLARQRRDAQQAGASTSEQMVIEGQPVGTSNQAVEVETPAPTEKGRLELRLDKTTAAHGEGAGRGLASALISGVSIEERERAYLELTEEGRRRYGDIIRPMER